MCPLVGVFALVEDVLIGAGFGILPCVLLAGRFPADGVLDREKGGLSADEEEGLFFRIDKGNLDVPGMVRSELEATCCLLREVSGVFNWAKAAFVPARSLCDLL